MILYVFIGCIAFNTKFVGSTEIVEMKIVDEPSSYGRMFCTNTNPPVSFAHPARLGILFGNNNLQQWGGTFDNNERLKMRVQPANVSGPPHLFHLRKKCFSKTFENYKYTFCPFSNVTQHEQGYNWNPYNGVLGVWQEWEVENNTFVSMEMQDGDDCGQIRRSVKVRLECGNTSEIISVSEPSTCHYVMIFHTPIVCHSQALLVYPTLPQELRAQWDLLEGRRYRGELTEKGFKKRLQVILEEAGLRLTAKQRHDLREAAVASDVKDEHEQAVQFNSLAHCTQMYRRLQLELRAAQSSSKNMNTSDAVHNAPSVERNQTAS